MYNKRNTIFEEKPRLPKEPFQEEVINPQGSGLEFDTFVAACEIPGGRVFWVVARSHEKRPYCSGTSADFKAAELAVLEVLNNKRALRRHAQFALDEYVEQKLEKVAGGYEGFAEAAQQEFLFEKYGHERYLVKRKSADEIILFAEPYNHRFQPHDHARTFHLDKRQLDNTGEAKARGKVFCTEERKWEIDRFKKTPSFLKIFGLDWEADISDVKYWFRKLSKEHHPDLGGDAEKFQEIVQAYEKAVKALTARNLRDGF